MIFFVDEEFLLYDFKKHSWELGDFNDSTIMVPENSVLIGFDKTQTTEFDLLAVGGLKFNME